MVNVFTLDVPTLLPLGLTTVTDTLPAVATLVAGTVATSWVVVWDAIASKVAPK